MSLPEPAPVLELIDAFRRSKVMFTAVKLGVFDLLAERSRSSGEMAAAANVNPGALQRLLEGCVSLGLLDTDGGVFQTTEVAATYLAKASAHSMAGYISYSDDVLYPMWAHLDDAVAEGTHRWQQTFQLSAAGLFDSFYSSADAMRKFLMGMHGFGTISSPAVVAAFDLSRFQRMVDLGGATGHLVRSACERYPGLLGVVFDLPKVAEFAREMLDQTPEKDRIRCTGGDFFTDKLPAADLYSLGRILHDWDVEKIRSLLARIFEALPDGGALLIAEKLMDEDHRGPVHVHMQSLNMLICTEGRERSLAEYSELLLEAGFSQVEGKKTGQPVDAILAVK